MNAFSLGGSEGIGCVWKIPPHRGSWALHNKRVLNVALGRGSDQFGTAVYQPEWHCLAFKPLIIAPSLCPSLERLQQDRGKAPPDRHEDRRTGWVANQSTTPSPEIIEVRSTARERL